jgi:hypothetical protein
MTLPIKGELVSVRWPGGPHDFVLQFDHVNTSIPNPPGWEHWVTLVGVANPGGWSRFYVQPVEPGVWTLLPKDCGPLPDGPPAPS